MKFLLFTMFNIYTFFPETFVSQAVIKKEIF